jgi:EmrB/QacA subfamily drug resistance transporter
MGENKRLVIEANPKYWRGTPRPVISPASLLVEPGQLMPTEPPLTHIDLSHSRWWLALTILLGQVTLAFSMFATVVALPKIMSAMSADVTSIHWVMTGFQIARTVPMPALGWLSSLVGNRTLYLAGLFTTVVSTICCGLAWNLESLIAFRVIQGIGAAPAQVTGMVILYEVFPLRQRGLVLGLLLLAGSMGPTIGPSLGGYLVQEYSWRAMFYLSLPTAVMSFILAPIILPKTARPPRPGFDPFGLLTMAIWIVALLLAITQGQRQGWDSAYIRGLFAIAGVFFVAFIILELTVTRPFLELGLYRNWRFVIASIAAFLYESAFNSANFLIALMLQQVFLFTPFHTGLILAPGAVMMGLAGVGAGRLADVIDPRGPILLGLLLQTMAMYSFGLTSLEVSTLWLTFLVILYRMSFGCVHTPLTSIVLNAVPKDRLSMGSGLDGIHRGFASAFGIALGSTVLEHRTLMHLTVLGQGHEASALSVQEATREVAPLLTEAGELGGAVTVKTLAVLREHLFQQAAMTAYQDTFLLLCVVTLLALLPAMLSRERRPVFTKQSNG